MRRRRPDSPLTLRWILLALTTAAAILLRPGGVVAQATNYPLISVEGLSLHNVAAEPVTLHGKTGLKVVVSEEAKRRYGQLTPEARAQSPLVPHARIEGLEFSSGVITAEIAGEPAPDAGEGARGFVGIAFRMQEDPQISDTFYLRPTNGRAEDQERRNHAVQYQSTPTWPWSRLRQETPSRYEAYVDLVTGAWTKIRIEVSGGRARLYVHDSPQPTLVVPDVKSGPNAKGAVALWLEPGTVAYFRDLSVTPGSAQR